MWASFTTLFAASWYQTTDHISISSASGRSNRMVQQKNNLTIASIREWTQIDCDWIFQGLPYAYSWQANPSTGMTPFSLLSNRKLPCLAIQDLSAAFLHDASHPITAKLLSLHILNLLGLMRTKLIRPSRRHKWDITITSISLYTIYERSAHGSTYTSIGC